MFYGIDMQEFGAAAEEAGAVEHYQNPTLYDHTYRHRRSDGAFYRTLADEKLGVGLPSPVLELACGSGRLTVPLLRAGHSVIGFDRSPQMLLEAANRVRRLPRITRENAFFFKADMRSFALKSPVALAVAGFHSLQHLVDDEHLLQCFRNVRASLRNDGWFAFDLLPPHPEWLGSTGKVRFNDKSVVDPKTGERIRYGESHRFDAIRKALHVQLVYQPVDEHDRDNGDARIVKLCHRQFWPGDLETLLEQAGLGIIARYSDFNFDATETAESLSKETHEHIFLAKPIGSNTNLK
jgi:SAM-dependent methyltransferase